MLKRYVGTYFLLLCFPFPLTLIPYIGNYLDEHYSDLWISIFHALNDRLWHFTSRAEVTGSGDALDNYFTFAALALLAIPIALAWKNFDRAKPWVDAIIKWFLAFMLFSYGFSKLNQFPSPHILRLYEPVGQTSPMGLLWTFMGASRAYTFFAGVMEVSAGVLLLIPRVQTLGAALTLGVMGNVFLLNMCYDVPVKLFSFQLVLFALWTLATDGERVVNFVKGHAVAALKMERPWFKAQLAATALMATVIVTNYFRYGDIKNDTPYQGTWDVETPGHWQRMVFYRKAIMMLQNKNGGLDRFLVTPKEPKGTYDIQYGVDKPSTIKFETVDATHLKITGDIKGEPVELTLAKEPGDVKFPLMTRGFHWVNETPYSN